MKDNKKYKRERHNLQRSITKTKKVQDNTESADIRIINAICKGLISDIPAFAGSTENELLEAKEEDRH